MYITESMRHNFGGFTLDTASIGSTSTSKTEMKLPYSGELPEPYDSATVFFRVSPEWVNVVLECRKGSDKPVKYPLTASRDEINAILWPFFFQEKKPGTYHTRFDCGLSAYWTGSYQRDYVAWKEYGDNPTRVVDVVRQLTPAQQDSLYRMLGLMRSEETAAG